jgi:hypothetical protein
MDDRSTQSMYIDADDENDAGIVVGAALSNLISNVNIA